MSQTKNNVGASSARPQAISLVTLLKNSGKKIAVAESITGGLIASEIVSVSGASEVFEDGFVSYSDAAKEKRLNIPKKLLQEKTAVSEEVCKSMIAGLFENTSADFAVSTTGYAEGSEGGRAFVGAGARGGEILVKEYFVDGIRNFVRKTLANYAIRDIIELIKKECTNGK